MEILKKQCCICPPLSISKSLYVLILEIVFIRVVQLPLTYRTGNDIQIWTWLTWVIEIYRIINPKPNYCPMHHVENFEISWKPLVRSLTCSWQDNCWQSAVTSSSIVFNCDVTNTKQYDKLLLSKSDQDYNNNIYFFIKLQSINPNSMRCAHIYIICITYML